MSQRIFISYRRDDAASDAGRLADHLIRRFGKDRVFLDVDTIDPGLDFVQVLHNALEQTAAVLVVIGPRWTDIKGADGTRRLDNPNDFVRLEVEASLGRAIPVVPVLVQGAPVPRADDLPASLAPLVRRQAMTLDYTEFHDDAERLCERLAPMIGFDAAKRPPEVRRWWPAAIVVGVLALGLASYLVTRGRGATETNAGAAATGNPSSADDLVAVASAQRKRNQYDDALKTLARARELAPASAAVRDAQEDAAMEWIRNVRVENGSSSFGDAIKPALAIVDAALPSAHGARRADLLAHTGWAAFLLWRDGDRRLDPGDTYREALAIDPDNPFANAMLAHWTLYQDSDAVPAAAKLFATAVKSGRALTTVRTLQWAAYTNAESNPQALAERVRLANTMRLADEHLDGGQAQMLWDPYYFALTSSRDRTALLDALPPDDHISTLNWAFAEYAAKDEARRMTIQYYVGLLLARAGRAEESATALRAVRQQLAASHASGALSEAVQSALDRVDHGSSTRNR